MKNKTNKFKSNFNFFTKHPLVISFAKNFPTATNAIMSMAGMPQIFGKGKLLDEESIKDLETLASNLMTKETQEAKTLKSDEVLVFLLDNKEAFEALQRVMNKIPTSSNQLSEAIAKFAPQMSYLCEEGNLLSKDSLTKLSAIATNKDFLSGNKAELVKILQNDSNNPPDIYKLIANGLRDNKTVEYLDTYKSQLNGFLSKTLTTRTKDDYSLALEFALKDNSALVIKDSKQMQEAIINVLANDAGAQKKLDKLTKDFTIEQKTTLNANIENLRSTTKSWVAREYATDEKDIDKFLTNFIPVVTKNPQEIAEFCQDLGVILKKAGVNMAIGSDINKLAIKLLNIAEKNPELGKILDSNVSTNFLLSLAALHHSDIDASVGKFVSKIFQPEKAQVLSKLFQELEGESSLGFNGFLASQAAIGVTTNLLKRAGLTENTSGLFGLIEKDKDSTQEVWDKDRENLHKLIKGVDREFGLSLAGWVASLGYSKPPLEPATEIKQRALGKAIDNLTSSTSSNELQNIFMKSEDLAGVPRDFLFSQVNIEDVKLEKIELHGENFVNSKLQDVSFNGSKLTNTSFKDAKLTNVSFADATIDGATLARLVQAIETGDNVSLKQAKIIGDISGVDLSKLDLTDVDFSGVTRMNFTKLPSLDNLKLPSMTIVASALCDINTAKEQDQAELKKTFSLIEGKRLVTLLNMGDADEKTQSNIEALMHDQNLVDKYVSKGVDDIRNKRDLDLAAKQECWNVIDCLSEHKDLFAREAFQTKDIAGAVETDKVCYDLASKILTENTIANDNKNVSAVKKLLKEAGFNSENISEAAIDNIKDDLIVFRERGWVDYAMRKPKQIKELIDISSLNPEKRSELISSIQTKAGVSTNQATGKDVKAFKPDQSLAEEINKIKIALAAETSAKPLVANSSHESAQSDLLKDSSGRSLK